MFDLGVIGCAAGLSHAKGLGPLAVNLLALWPKATVEFETRIQLGFRAQGIWGLKFRVWLALRI